MNAFRTTLVLAFALTACAAQSEEDQLEKAIRDTLASQGEVKEVEMARQEDGSMTGHVMILEPNGRLGRLACSAKPGAEAGKYEWKCSPAIDEKTIGEMEAIIRAELEKRGPVLELEMQRAGDDDHMTGRALVKDEAGDEYRLACSATRNEGTATFAWTCADAEEEEAPPAEG